MSLREQHVARDDERSLPSGEAVSQVLQKEIPLAERVCADGAPHAARAILGKRFDQLMDQARAAFSAGDLRASAALFAQAETLAVEHCESDLADRAFTIRCGVAIELDEARDLIPRLKEVLLRSGDIKTRWRAAYCCALAYDLDDDSDRATAYSERALELAEEFDDPGVRARSANLVGNLALRGSRLQEAEAAYTRALACHRGTDGYRQVMEAQERDNLGYVLMCTGRVEEGVRLCEEARATLELMNATHYLHQTLQDLCYGYLLCDDLERAQRNGERALALAGADGDALVVKNSLFLLSETAVRSGDPFRARRYLRELAAHYPEVGVSEEIIDVFLVTDLTQVVNLRG